MKNSWNYILIYFNRTRHIDVRCDFFVYVKRALADTRHGHAGEEINMRNKTITQGISIRLGRLRDVELIHSLKYQAFLPLYEKYHDDETNPAKENQGKVLDQLKQENSDYYVIRLDGKEVGGIRIKHDEQEIYTISPIFIIPEFQNQGIASDVLKRIFSIYPEAMAWILDTILQEQCNCHLYEKIGFTATEYKKEINDSMTLIEYRREG